MSLYVVYGKSRFEVLSWRGKESGIVEISDDEIVAGHGVVAFRSRGVANLHRSQNCTFVRRRVQPCSLLQ